MHGLHHTASYNISQIIHEKYTHTVMEVTIYPKKKVTVAPQPNSTHTQLGSTINGKGQGTRDVKESVEMSIRGDL